METFSALLALYARNSPVTDEFPPQKPVTWSFDVFFDLCLDKRLSKHLWGWWFETPSCSLWRHCNVLSKAIYRPEWLVAQTIVNTGKYILVLFTNGFQNITKVFMLIDLLHRNAVVIYPDLLCVMWIFLEISIQDFQKEIACLANIHLDWFSVN